MSTHHVRRLYPPLRARHRYRRQPFCWHHPGDDPLGAIVRDVVSGQHRSERVPSDPSGGFFPAISGLGTLATSVQMCEDLGAKRSPRTAANGRGHVPLDLTRRDFSNEF
jgi:hypothetical protein